ncbi:MAG: amidohydrolase [Spirochaetales bacterium]|nr:amidohydrolase [Spirochaetales bacterium]
MKKIDLLIKNACIITMNAGRRILYDASVAVLGNLIIEVGPSAEIDVHYDPEKIIDAHGKYLFPGFVTTHTHLFQTLLKGLGRDKPLLEWLNSSVKRALGFYDEEAMHYAALLGLIEAVRTGTTTVTDFQYCHMGPGFDIPVIEAYEKLGVRGVMSKAHTDVSSFAKDFGIQYIETEDDYFRELEDLCSKYAGHQFISMSMAPGIIWDHSREGFLRTRESANRLGIPITMHVVETADDDQFCMERWGMRTIPFLEECGLLGPDFVAVHSVYLTPEDIKTFKKYGVSVSHCPIPNMLLGSGAAPIPRLLEEGVNVSLACDGAASNDGQDMLEVLKITALQHKLISHDASVVSASEVLEMATLGGAKALGMEKEVGSIEVGKCADMFIYNPYDCRSIPVNDPISSIVYSSSRINVETTIINGKIVMEKGVIYGIDEEYVLNKAWKLANGIVSRAGIGNIQWGQKIRPLNI